jgi:hypothetical protein
MDDSVRLRHGGLGGLRPWRYYRSRLGKHLSSILKWKMGHFSFSDFFVMQYWPFVYEPRFVELNRGGVGAVASIVLLLLTLTLILAAYLVRPSRVLCSTFISAISHLYRVTGLVLAGVGVYLKIVGTLGTTLLITDRLGIAAIAAGAVMLIVGTVGLNGKSN